MYYVADGVRRMNDIEHGRGMPRGSALIVATIFTCKIYVYTTDMAARLSGKKPPVSREQDGAHYSAGASIRTQHIA
jgi:hypothetical protein